MKKNSRPLFPSVLSISATMILSNSPNRTILMNAGPGFAFIRSEIDGKEMSCALCSRNDKLVLMVNRAMAIRLIELFGRPRAKPLKLIGDMLRKAAKTGRATIKVGPDLLKTMAEETSGDRYTQAYLQSISTSITKTIPIHIEVEDEVVLDVQLKKEAAPRIRTTSGSPRPGSKYRTPHLRVVPKSSN